MSTNCFLKRLNVDVDINNPQFFGFIALHLDGNVRIPEIIVNQNTKCVIIGDGTRCNTDFTPPATPVKEFTHLAVSSNIYVTGNNYILLIEKKYIIRFGLYLADGEIVDSLQFDIDGCKGIESLMYLTLNVLNWSGTVNITGNIGKLKNCPSLRSIDLYGTNVIGRAEDLIVNLINTGLTTLSGDGLKIIGSETPGRTFNGHTFTSSKFTWVPSGNNFVVTRGYGGAGFPNTEVVTIDKNGNVVNA